MNWMVYAGFTSYVILVIFVGIIKGRNTKGTSGDFLNSSRDHRSVIAALSASAACESGWVMLGLVGTAYTVGVSTFWLLPGALIGYGATWFLVGRRFRDLSAQANTTSTPSTLAALFPRYRQAILIVGGIIVVIFMSVYVAAQFNASGKAFEGVLNVPYAVGVWVSMALVLSYSLIGGTRSVSWTNLIQATIMVLALVIMPIIVLIHAVGGESILDSLQHQDPNLLSFVSGKTGFDAFSLIAGWVFIGIAVPGMPHVLRRFIAASRQPQVIKHGSIISIAWSQTVFIGAITLGLSARAYGFGFDDPEKTLPLVALQLLPEFLAGLMLAAVWAAMSSTADSQLIEAVSAVTEDLRYGLQKSKFTKIITGSNDQTSVRKSLRIWTIVLAVLSAIMASTKDRNIFALVLDAWNVLGASFAPPVLFLLLYKRTSGAGILLGMVCGALTVFLWRYIIEITWLSPLVAGFVVSCIAIFVGSLLFPKEEQPTNYTT